VNCFRLTRRKALLRQIILIRRLSASARLQRTHAGRRSIPKPDRRLKNDEAVNEHSASRSARRGLPEFPGLPGVSTLRSLHKQGRNGARTIPPRTRSLPDRVLGYTISPRAHPQCGDAGCDFVAHTGSFHTSWRVRGFKHPPMRSNIVLADCALGSNPEMRRSFASWTARSPPIPCVSGARLARVEKLDRSSRMQYQVSEGVRRPSTSHPGGGRIIRVDGRRPASDAVRLHVPFDVMTGARIRDFRA